MYAFVLGPEKLTGRASVHEHPARSCGFGGGLLDLESSKSGELAEEEKRLSLLKKNKYISISQARFFSLRVFCF